MTRKKLLPGFAMVAGALFVALALSGASPSGCGAGPKPEPTKTFTVHSGPPASTSGKITTVKP